MTDLSFYTSGPGPVRVEAHTPEGEDFLGCAETWCDGPGTAHGCCVDAILGGLTCRVDGADVTLRKA